MSDERSPPPSSPGVADSATLEPALSVDQAVPTPSPPPPRQATKENSLPHVQFRRITSRVVTSVAPAPDHDHDELPKAPRDIEGVPKHHESPWADTTGIHRKGEKSRKFRRTVYDQKAWRQHRNPYRHFKHAWATLRSDLALATLPYVIFFTIEATGLCLFWHFTVREKLILDTFESLSLSNILLLLLLSSSRKEYFSFFLTSLPILWWSSHLLLSWVFICYSKRAISAHCTHSATIWATPSPSSPSPWSCYSPFAQIMPTRAGGRRAPCGARW